jgi:hypothetical protein
MSLKHSEYEAKIKPIDSAAAANSIRLKDLQMEIERLSRLYDFEVAKQMKYEEKMLNLKQMAEEKQIESAALKYEYRKVQEIKDNLIAENNSLKQFLNSLHHSSSSNLLLNVSRHSSPNNKSPRVVHQTNNNNNSYSTAPSTPVVSTNNNLQIQGNLTFN